MLKLTKKLIVLILHFSFSFFLFFFFFSLLGQLLAVGTWFLLKVSARARGCGARKLSCCLSVGRAPYRSELGGSPWKLAALTRKSQRRDPAWPGFHYAICYIFSYFSACETFFSRGKRILLEMRCWREVLPRAAPLPSPRAAGTMNQF